MLTTVQRSLAQPVLGHGMLAHLTVPKHAVRQSHCAGRPARQAVCWSRPMDALHPAAIGGGVRQGLERRSSSEPVGVVGMRFFLAYFAGTGVEARNFAALSVEGLDIECGVRPEAAVT